MERPVASAGGQPAVMLETPIKGLPRRNRLVIQALAALQDISSLCALRSERSRRRVAFSRRRRLPKTLRSFLTLISAAVNYERRLAATAARRVPGRAGCSTPLRVV